MIKAASEIRVAIIAPTFNNAGTLAEVLRSLEPLGLLIIAVNDGSTDETAAVLDGLANSFVGAWHSSPEMSEPATTVDAGVAPIKNLTILTHDKNRGKAAAMRTGFEHALAAGFTHAVTIDTDGQHDTGDIPALLAAAQASPTALVIGTRPAAVEGCPAANLFARRLTNFFVWVDSGIAVGDSQCGLRIYPLDLTLRIPARAARYGFETEILTRFGWAQLPVIEVPVRGVYQLPGGRVTHFKRGPDTLSAIAMHARLLTRSLFILPPRAMARPTATGTLCQRFGRWMNPMTAWRAIRNSAAERPRFAVALSAGVMIANLPLYGLQSVLSLLVARRFRLPPLAVLAGSHASMPPFGPLLIALAIGVGHWLLHGEYLSFTDLDPRNLGYLELLKRVAADWIVGGVACGIAMAMLTYILARLTLGFVPLAAGSSPAR